jgi:hypothetical protein
MRVGHKTTVIQKVNALLLAAMFLSITALGAAENSVPIQESADSQVVGPLKPLRSGVTGDLISAALLAHDERRSAALREYTAVKRHRVFDSSGEIHAEEISQIEYHAPNKMTSVVTAQKGWGPGGHFTLYQVVASDVDAAATEEDRDSSINSANYQLKPLGEQQVGPFHCFVMQAIPKRKEPYLFEGKIWIDDQDFAIVRIEGHPAKRPSFWVAREDSVRVYQKFDGFWLPERDERLVVVRLYGTKILTTDHWDYVVNHAIESQSVAGAPPEPPSGMCTVCAPHGPDALRTPDTSAKAFGSTQR